MAIAVLGDAASAATPATPQSSAAAPAASRPASTSSASAALDRFLNGLQTWRSDFTQVLTDSRGRRLEAVQGALLVSRPGKFRWEVRAQGASPGADASSDAATQVMVADGRNVWFYDRELEQVTVKPAAEALTATPATLLAGGLDLAREFELRKLPRRGGLEWVGVRPRRLDAEFREARLGFAGVELRSMQLVDRLGQTAVVDFSRSARNPSLPAGTFAFVPPPGVDVIGKPLT